MRQSILIQEFILNDLLTMKIVNHLQNQSHCYLLIGSYYQLILWQIQYLQMIEQGKERIRRIREKIAELSKIDPSNYLSQDELQKIKSKFSIKVSSNTQHYPKLDEEITRPKPIVQNPLKKKFRNVCNLDTQYFKQLHIKLDVEVQEKLKQNMENIKKWRLVGVKNINRASEDNKDSYDFLGQSQRDGQIDQHLNNKQDKNLNKDNVCKQLENQKEENPNKQAVINMILDKKQEQKQVETKNAVGLFSNTSPSLLFANSNKQTENKPFFGLFPTAAPVSLFSNLTKEQKGAEIKPIVEHINTNSSPLFQIPAKNNPTIGLFPTSSIISPTSLLSNPPNQSEAKPTLGLFSKTATAPASLFSNFIKQPEVKPSIGFFSNATPTLLFPSSLKEKNQSENKSATEIFPIKAQSPLFSNSFKESEAKPTGALFSNTTSTSLFPNSTKQTEQKPTLGLFSSTTPKPLFQNHLKEQKQIETKPTIGLFSISPISNPPKQAEKKPSIGLFPGAAQTSLFSNPSQQPKQPETKPASGLFANTAPIFANPAKQDETKPNSGPSISASPISLFPNPPKEKIQLHTKPVVGLFSNKPSLPLSSNPLLTEEKPATGLFSNITPVQSFNPPKQAENKPTIGLFNSSNTPSLFTNIASSSLFPSSNKQSETKPSIGLFSSSSQVPLFPSVPKQAEIKPHIGITSNAAPTLLFPSFSKQTEAKPLFSNTTSSSLFSNSAKQTEIKHTSGLFNAAPTSLPPHTPKQSEIQPSGGLFPNMISSPASLHSNTSSGLIFSSLPKEQKQSENKQTVGLFGTTTQPSLFSNPPKQQKQADNKLSAIGPGGTKLSLHSFNIKQVNKSQSSNPFKSINPFMQSAQSSSFLNPNPPSNLPNPSNTLFSNSLFSLPSNSNSGGLFSNLQKSIFNKQSNAQIPDAEQDEGQQDDDGPIVAQDDANPQLSTVKYDYVQTTVHFKQPANKFREGTKETLQNVVVSIEQFQGSEDVFLFIRMQNKCITFNGKILKNITQTRILNNNSKNVEVKKILSVKDSISAKPQLSIIRLQFKQSEIGSLFVKKFEKASKMNPQ